MAVAPPARAPRRDPPDLGGNSGLLEALGRAETAVVTSVARGIAAGGRSGSGRGRGRGSRGRGRGRSPPGYAIVCTCMLFAYGLLNL